MSMTKINFFIVFSIYLIWQCCLYACAETDFTTVEISEEVIELSELYGEEYGICPELIQAICWHESRCDSGAISKNRKYLGLMQIYQGHEMFEDYDLLDADMNIKAGCELLSEYQETYEDISVALDVFSGYGLKYAKQDDMSRTTRYLLALSKYLEDEKDGYKG